MIPDASFHLSFTFVCPKFKSFAMSCHPPHSFIVLPLCALASVAALVISPPHCLQYPHHHPPGHNFLHPGSPGKEVAGCPQRRPGTALSLFPEDRLNLIPASLLSTCEAPHLSTPPPHPILRSDLERTEYLRAGEVEEGSLWMRLLGLLTLYPLSS